MKDFLLALAAAACLTGGTATAMTVDFETAENLDEAACKLPNPRNHLCNRASGFVFLSSYYEDYPGWEVEDEGLVSAPVVREGGARFSVTSVAIFRASSAFGPYRTGLGPFPGEDSPDYSNWLYDSVYAGLNFGVYGIRNGVVVGAYEFGRVDPGQTPFTLTLGPGFSNLDEMRIAIILPFDEVLRFGDQPDQPGQLWCVDYCSAIALTSMEATVMPTPSPVPLPASLPMLAAGLAGLGFWRRKKA